VPSRSNAAAWSRLLAARSFRRSPGLEKPAGVSGPVWWMHLIRGPQQIRRRARQPGWGDGMFAVRTPRSAGSVLGFGRRWLLAVGVVSTVVGGVGVADAASKPSPVVPGGVLVAGRGYGQWVAAAFTWRLTLPSVTSNRTSCLATRQHGPVWFLNESNTNAPAITITCAIPADRSVMLFSPSAICSTLDYPAATRAGLMRCAKRLWKRAPASETVTLDGANLSPAGYVGGTPAFAFKMPAHNNWLNRPGRTRGRLAVYGAATILQPLSAGTHTLVQIVSFAHSPAYTTTYQLTVG
jgi:hypothetical protein